MLTYKKSNKLEIIRYLGFDFDGCKNSCRSTLGYTYMLAGVAISWKSAKQMLMAPSNMAVEFIASYKASNHAIWLSNCVTGLRIMDRI